jgi:hypothetical protein
MKETRGLSNGLIGTFKILCRNAALRQFHFRRESLGRHLGIADAQK